MAARLDQPKARQFRAAGWLFALALTGAGLGTIVAAIARLGGA